MKPKKAFQKRLIIVVGPTASGKSEFAVRLAKKLNGEIISADSRQVYRGLDIGAGKVEGKWQKPPTSQKVYVYKNIPHYLIDVASPLRQYSVARYKKAATAAMGEIFAKGKIAIICGGTGHWIDAVVFGQALPEIGSNKQLRAKLSSFTTTELYKKLQKLDPVRAKNIDVKNPRRLIRALEIIMSTGKPVPTLKTNTEYLQGVEIEWIGLNPGMDKLEQKIHRRLKERLESGLIDEVQNLHSSKNGTALSWKRLESFGLEYKYCALFLQNKISREELNEQLYRAIRQYAKRQMTWWKKNKSIRWRSY